MNNRGKLLAVGATESVGRRVVAEVIRDGYSFSGLVRDPGGARYLPFGVEVVVGDMTQPKSLGRVVADVDAIVFTHGTHGGNHEAARAIVVNQGCREMVLSRENPKGSPSRRSIINSRL